MMRHLNRTLLITSLVLAAAGCGGKKDEAATGTTTTTAAPQLPADVQSVSAAATSTTGTATTATTTAVSSTDTTGTASGSVATAADNGGTIVATGEFVSPVRSELAVKMPGRVAKMYVDEGAHVSRGQALLDLETDYVRINLQRAEADVARAKAAADDARRDLDRKKDLIAKDSIPRATFDRSQSAYDQATAALQSAQAQAALLRQQINDSVLRSPIDGVVAEKRTDVGQRLGDNTVALVVVQTSPLKLRFRVPERYLAEVRKGQPVKASVDPYPNQSFQGNVTVIGGVIDSASRSLLVETEFPNRDGKLKPGLFARVELQPAK